MTHVNLRCLLGFHDWQGYRSGLLGDYYVTRSWCPRCKADSILFGTYREVTQNVWTDKTPADDEAEFAAMMRKLQQRRDELRIAYAEHVAAPPSKKVGS